MRKVIFLSPWHHVLPHMVQIPLRYRKTKIQTSRDILFYLHAFIISFALSWFWDRFKGLFKGPSYLRGLEFGFVYSLVALLPVMWITFSALDITIPMVLSWFLYGMAQSVTAGLIFAKINP